MTFIPGTVLAMLGVAACFALFRSAAARPPKRDPETGELILQNSPALVWTMGAIAVGGPLGMAFLSLIIPFENPGQVFVPVGLGAFFLLLGGALCGWAIRRRTRLGEDGLTSEYLLFPPQFLPWQEVVKVDFASGQEFWVRGSGGEKAMLFVWFVGCAEAVPLLYERLPPKVVEKYRATIEAFAMTVGA